MIDICCICKGKANLKAKIFYGEFIQFKDYDYQYISICSKCGFIFTANPLSLEKTNEYYKTTSRHNYSTISQTMQHLQRSKKQMSFILDAIEPDDVKTVLEIGATSGSSLNLFKEKGFNVLGTDLSLSNVNFAKSNFDIDIFHMDFDTFYESNNQSFDLINLSHILEHIINPHEFIMKIASINSKYVFIAVPCFDYRYIDTPYGIFIPTHHSYFTLESLKNLMRASNYRLLDADLLLAGEAQRAAPAYPQIYSIWEKDIQNCTEVKLPTISSEQHLDFYIEKCEIQLKWLASRIDEIPNNLRLAVWPLGLHTALLYKHTSIGDKNVIKFYDKNSVFYDRKIIGKQVSPFSKTDAEEQNIEAILISSYQFQPAILESVKNSGADFMVITLY